MKELTEYTNIKKEMWISYLINLYRRDTGNTLPETSDITENDDTPITEEEVKKALGKLKIGSYQVRTNWRMN
jgi:uncharacterized protein (DUF2141 family)